MALLCPIHSPHVAAEMEAGENILFLSGFSWVAWWRPSPPPPPSHCRTSCCGTNLWSGYCECMGGRNSEPCVHKHSIAQHFQTSMFSVLPTMDANMRALCHVIATGTAQEDEWYRTPANPDTNMNKFIQDYEDRCASAACSCHQ